MGKFVGVLFLFLSLVASSYAQSCSNFAFSGNRVFATCNNLPVLNSVLHWTYHQANHTADIAYRHAGVTASNWVAWGLNVGGSGMRGTQCLVAFQNSSGSIHAYTSPLPTSSYATQLAEGSLSFGVSKISAELTGGEIIIFATLALPAGRTNFNQAWQDGSLSGTTPQAHAQTGNNMRSTGTVDFATGQTSAGGGSDSFESVLRRRHVHGVLNAVSWGILMPMGAVIARYLKVFKSADPAWFYLHVACQTTAYAVGVAGWGTGLKLGSDSKGVTQDTHRNIGITLFALGTLQVFALLLRPKPDHKLRFYWNIYHHAVGYTVIILSVINVYEGFDVLNGQKNWKKAYTGVIIFLGAVAALLEAFTWFIVLKRRSANKQHPAPHHAANGNGYSV
nr:cytochrome B561 and DOMON domain-containing protein At5g47530-like [Ipomoea batatas]